MSTEYGLTLTGFVPKTLPVLVEEMQQAFRDEFGASIDVSENSAEGQIIGIVCERYAELWEGLEQINASQDPDSATGAALVQLCALTGVQPEGATNSTDILTLTGDPTTVVTAGNRASTGSTESAFETLVDVTLLLLDAWTITTAYVVGDRVTNSARAYICITAGTSAGAGGPTTTADDITDGTVHWRYLGEGTAAGDVTAQSVLTGPVVAVSGDITVIETPVGGWSSVINLLDADPGTDDETDEAIRVRREEELAVSGEPTVDGIRRAILDLDDVTACTVFYNNTDTTDGDGVPPHAVEALVLGGDDQDIWDTLLASVAAGVATHGTEDGTALDDEGTSHVISFSRYSEITIYVDITLTYDAATYPSDGDDQVKTAIVAFGDAQKGGKDAVAVAIGAQAFRVAGVLDVPRTGALGGTLIKVSAGPTVDTTIAVTTRQLATYDTSRITVHSTPATP